MLHCTAHVALANRRRCKSWLGSLLNDVRESRLHLVTKCEAFWPELVSMQSRDLQHVTGFQLHDMPRLCRLSRFPNPEFYECSPGALGHLCMHPLVPSSAHRRPAARNRNAQLHSVMVQPGDACPSQETQLASPVWQLNVYCRALL